MSFTNIFWYLQTVHKCYMEQFLLLTMFISFYGTAPWGCVGLTGPCVEYTETRIA